MCLSVTNACVWCVYEEDMICNINVDSMLYSLGSKRTTEVMLMHNQLPLRDELINGFTLMRSGPHHWYLPNGIPSWQDNMELFIIMAVMMTIISFCNWIMIMMIIAISKSAKTASHNHEYIYKHQRPQY